ncbi:hypothetical protein D3C76_1788580 [compost metagenome]
MSSNEGKIENCKASFVFIETSRIIKAIEILMTSRISSSHDGIGRIIIRTIPMTPARTVISFIFTGL